MRKTILSVLVTLLVLSGCAFRKATRPEPDSGIGLSGSFSAEDSPQVAREISLEVTSQAWLEQFKLTHKRSPVLMIGPLSNESQHPIDMARFASQLLHEILNAGQVRFVEALPTPFTTPGKATLEVAGELGADFMLAGSFSVAELRDKGKGVKYLQLDMRLLEVVTGQTVWAIQRPAKQAEL